MTVKEIQEKIVAFADDLMVSVEKLEKADTTELQKELDVIKSSVKNSNLAISMLYDTAVGDCVELLKAEYKRGDSINDIIAKMQALKEVKEVTEDGKEEGNVD